MGLFGKSIGPSGDPRVTVPDRYPRGSDPSRGANDPYVPEFAEAVGVGSYGNQQQGNPLSRLWNALTGRVPRGQRPLTYRRFITYQLTATTIPQPLLNQISEVETIMVQAPETASVPLFIGGQNVNAVSGIRLNAGRGVVITETNDRRIVESIERQDEQTALLGTIAGMDYVPGAIEATPVTVLNPNDFYVVAEVDRPVNVWLFFPPERL